MGWDGIGISLKNFLRVGDGEFCGDGGGGKRVGGREGEGFGGEKMGLGEVSWGRKERKVLSERLLEGGCTEGVLL